MKTELVDGVPLGNADAEVLKVLKRIRDPLGGDAKKVGFKNEDGVIYRTAILAGTHQLLSLSNRVEPLGFSDELYESPYPKNGYNAIFAPSK